MVNAAHSGGSPNLEGKILYGGDPAGFIIEADGKKIYHAGDTTVMADMEIISELYQPEYALLPVGGRFTMGPREAAYAVTKYLKSVKHVFPMHYGTLPNLTGTPEQTRIHFDEFKGKHSREDVNFMDPMKYTESAIDLE